MLTLTTLSALETDLGLLLPALQESSIGTPAQWQHMLDTLVTLRKEMEGPSAWKGRFACTYLGNKIFLEEPKIEDIDIEDIAHHAAHICRYNGGTYTHLSVAQHSLLVSDVLIKMGYQWLAFAGLLHDAAEAIVGDCISPIKCGLVEYMVLEQKIQNLINQRFGIYYESYTPIHMADLIVRKTEVRDFLPNNREEWPELREIEALPGRIHPMSAEEAKAAFLRRFEQLYLQQAA